MFDRRFFILNGLFLVLGSGLALAEFPREIPFDQASYDAALDSGKPLLVEVSAPWCPTCKAQKVALKSLLREPRFEGLTVLDVDFDNQKDVVRALGAQRQSTLIIYGNGVEIDRSVGETDPDAIAALIASAF